MADIRERLVLEDKFSSTLNKFANKMSSTSRMTQAAAATVESSNSRAAASTQSASQKMTESAKASSVDVSDATQQLVERLGLVEEAMHRAFTDKQADAALSALEQQMRRVGLVWTTSAAEMESADLLMRVGLQELANQGQIAANVIAQAAHTTQLEKEAAQQAAQAEGHHAATLSNVRAAIGGAIRAISSYTASLFRHITATQSAGRAHGLLERQLRRMAFTLFSVRRIFRFLSETIERAPKGLQKSWIGAVTGVKDTFARAFVSMLQSMQPAIDRFNAFLNSPAGKRFAHGLETAMSLAGQAVGWLLDKVTALGAWIGNNFNTVMAVAGVLLTMFAAKMFLTAVAVMAANAPLLLLIGLAALLVVSLQQAGFTSEEIFTGIGKTLGWLYALAYNLVTDAWNLIASFAEFFANVWDDPLGATARLFYSVFDTILSIVESVANAIDALTGKNWSGAVAGFRADMQKWADDTFGTSKIKIARMEKIDTKTTMDAWGDAGAKISTQFSALSLDAKLSPKLTNIEKNTAKTAQNTNSWDENLAMLEDVTIRRYSTKVNTTSLVPSITVNLRGGGDKDMAVDIGNTLKVMLAEQMASHTTASYGEVF